MLDAPQNDLKDKLAKLRRDGEERAAQRLAEKLGFLMWTLAKVPVSLDAVRILAGERGEGRQSCRHRAESE